MEQLNFSNIAKLAKALGTHITCFDLEATTFRGKANFGITEVACLTVTTDARVLTYAAIINPERKIDPAVVDLTGLTQEMVDKGELWSLRYAEHFEKLAKDYWVFGFNNKTFDEPAVADINRRYGRPIPGFARSFDVRQLHLVLSAATSKKGKLAEVAAFYGVPLPTTLHRAAADVMLTANVLERILDVYGHDAVLAQIRDKPKDAKDKLSAIAIARYVKSKAKVTLSDLEVAFKADIADISFEVGKAIDEGLVDPERFAVEPVIAWVSDALVEIDPDVLMTGKLKPIYLELKKSSQGIPGIDYVQLRIALSRAGISWSSKKL